jgi:hypothetical protein
MTKKGFHCVFLGVITWQAGVIGYIWKVAMIQLLISSMAVFYYSLVIDLDNIKLGFVQLGAVVIFRLLLFYRDHF